MKHKRQIPSWLQLFLSQRPSSHELEAVTIGGGTIFAGGGKCITPAMVRKVNPGLIVPLTRQHLPLPFRGKYTVLAAPLEDFAGTHPDWANLVKEVAAEVASGKTVLCYCDAGHGRTGTLLASLIAVMEPQIADPLAAVRERYCVHAVETTAQAQAIFALRQQEVPQQYRGTFTGDRS